jgi:hypothetical protein
VAMTKKNISFWVLLASNIFQALGTGLLSTIPYSERVLARTYVFEVIMGTGIGFSIVSLLLIARAELSPNEQGMYWILFAIDPPWEYYRAQDFCLHRFWLNSRNNRRHKSASYSRGGDRSWYIRNSSFKLHQASPCFSSLARRAIAAISIE